MDNITFLKKVETFLQESGMKPTPFGVAALKDPTFVWELRRGRNVSLDVCNRVMEFISDHQTEPAEG